MHHDLTDAHHEPLRVTRLVVAPHAGDEVLGCGGMLAKHHDDAAVVVLVDPDEQRLEQLRTARRMLGSPPVSFLGLPDGQLADHVERIVSALSGLIARVRPAELYLPYPSLHQDHVVAYEAGMRATRSPVRAAWPPVSVLLYEAGGPDVDDYPADIRWSVGESLQQEDIDRKVAAALGYRSRLAHTLKERAAGVGSVRGLPWAEQFALVRAAPGGLRRDETVQAVVQAEETVQATVQADETMQVAVPVMAGGQR
ncbi:MAG: PIG-L family deacetylase [Aeromicrobium sp.]